MMVVEKKAEWQCGCVCAPDAVMSNRAFRILSFQFFPLVVSSLSAAFVPVSATLLAVGTTAASGSSVASGSSGISIAGRSVSASTATIVSISSTSVVVATGSTAASAIAVVTVAARAAAVVIAVATAVSTVVVAIVVSAAAVAVVSVAVTTVASRSAAIVIASAEAAAVVVAVATKTATTTTGTAVIYAACQFCVSNNSAAVLTSLGRAEVFAGSRGSGPGAAGLLNAQGATLVDLALETGLGSIGLLASGHVDKAKAARLAGVGIAHDAAGVDITVLLEKAADLLFSQARVDASDEKVGTRVGGFLFIFAGLGRATGAARSAMRSVDGVWDARDLPVITSTSRRCTAESAVAVAVRAGRTRALARVLGLV